MIFGYAAKKVNAYGLLELREVTFHGTPADLREIASFLVDAANEMELDEHPISHRHLSIECPAWKSRHPQHDVIAILRDS